MCGVIWYCCDDGVTIEEQVSCMNASLLQYITLYRYGSMIKNRSTYKRLAASMESPYFDTTTPKRKMLVDFWATQNEKYLKLLIVLGNCTLLAWSIFPLMDDIEYNFMVGTHIPFFYKTTVRYPFAYIAVVIPFWYSAYFIMIIDLTMQAHLMHLLCQLTVLGDCFENLLQDCQVGFEGTHQNYLIYNKEFVKKYTQRMGILVKQHQIILSNIMSLRDILSRPMFCQFMTSGTLICFVAYETILALTANTIKTVNGLFFLGYNLFELYIICRWCDEIRIQGQNIAESIYSCGWESGLATFPGIKQTVKLVIARAHKPLTFTAGGMYDLSLASFSNLVKTSYTALSVVLQMEK